MRIIGLNGRAGSGKDTAFNTIWHAAGVQGKNAQRVAFADKLKLSAARALGFDPRDADEAVELCNEIKDSGSITTISSGANRRISGREFLQRYGTEAHRDVFGGEFWIDALLPKPVEDDVLFDQAGAADARLAERFPGVDVLVVTDVRFENEAKRIRDLGGENWYIDADARLGPLPEDAHSSERGIPNELVDKVVYNNCELLNYQKNVVEAYQS